MKLSVIICTHNRAAALAPCLDSVASAIAQSAADAEIVLVDNASTDGTAAVVENWSSGAKVPVRLVHEPKKGVATARNSGVRAASGTLLAFTDDDCRMGKTYVTEVLRYFAQDKEPVIRGGRIELGDSADLPLTIRTDASPMRWTKGMKSANHELIAGKALSGCNMVMPREVVTRLGLFDERLGPGTSIPGGEDTDYYLRAFLAGIPIEYVPDMTIFHWHGRKTSRDANKLMRNYLVSTGALYAKYIFKAPYLCKEFYWDLKKACKELFRGSNDFMPDWHLSYRDKVSCCLRGMIQYARDGHSARPYVNVPRT